MKVQAKLDKIITVQNVTKVFEDGVTVLDDINLSIKRGEFVTLLGPSGCGKTTLLRMIAGFTSPTKGEIYIENQPITSVPPYKRPVNTVFQKYALFPHLNVFNNVAYGLKLKTVEDPAAKKGTRKLIKKEIAEKVNRALNLVGLADYGHRDVNSLSGGQQQRVAIARAIVCEPKVLLLDEPLGALDLKMRKEMQLELKRMHKDLGITYICDARPGRGAYHVGHGGSHERRNNSAGGAAEKDLRRAGKRVCRRFYRRKQYLVRHHGKRLPHQLPRNVGGMRRQRL